MAVFVARQPIFDRAKRVFGYELLFRSGLENFCNTDKPDESTVDVIANSFLVIGLDELTDGRRGFINFTRNLILSGVPSMLPQEGVVVELLEDIEPDEEILAACRKLQKDGYILAMDDFILEHKDSPLIEYADIVKIDYIGTTPLQRKELCSDLLGQGVTLLAEKVETPEDFEEALGLGFTYFQGYFFSKPTIQVGKEIPGNKLTQMQILNEVNKPDVSHERFEEIIKQDVSMTYKLLRFMNSAWFGFRAEISSIKHALVLLGPREFRKWVSLVALRSVADDKPPELVMRSITRAKVAEEIATMTDLSSKASELFLMGMFSFVDALTDMSLEDALAKLPISDDIRLALLEKKGKFGAVLLMIESYETGQWDQFAKSAAEIDIPEADVPELFNTSWKWAKEAFAAA